MAHDLACDELVELVTDYLEGALPSPERVRFEMHLSECGPCEHYVEQMRLTIKAAGRLTEETIEPQAREALLKVFRDWKNNG